MTSFSHGLCQDWGLFYFSFLRRSLIYPGWSGTLCRPGSSVDFQPLPPTCWNHRCAPPAFTPLSWRILPTALLLFSIKVFRQIHILTFPDKHLVVELPDQRTQGCYFKWMWTTRELRQHLLCALQGPVSRPGVVYSRCSRNTPGGEMKGAAPAGKREVKVLGWL